MHFADRRGVLARWIFMRAGWYRALEGGEGVGRKGECGRREILKRKTTSAPYPHAVIRIAQLYDIDFGSKNSESKYTRKAGYAELITRG